MGRSSLASSTCEVKGLLSGPRMKVWQWPYFQGTFILNYSKCSETKWGYSINHIHTFEKLWDSFKKWWKIRERTNRISVWIKYLSEQNICLNKQVLSQTAICMCYWFLIQIFVPSAVPVVYWETRSCTT